MNIAVIVPSFPVLSETFILNQITGLLDRGHSVHIFARSRGKDKEVHLDVKKYKLLARTFYFDIPSNKLIRLVKAIPLLARNIGQNPRAILGSLNFVRYGTDALCLGLLFMLVPFLARYDIVHCHFGEVGNFGAVLKALGLQNVLVVTFHGYDIRKALKEGGVIYRELMHEGDCFIAISDYNYRNLLQFGFDATKVVYHPVGIDYAKFSQDSRFERPLSNPHPIKLISVARLVEDKGLKYGVHAVHKLLQIFPDVKVEYNIIGSGPLRTELETLINILGLNGIIHLIGPKNQEEVIKALSESHIFLLPSIAESLPLALMEAEATGLPVVATAVGSTNQIVIDNKSGFLVPAGNPDALADKLAYLIEHPERWAEMGKAGREQIAQHYDIDRLNDQLQLLYQRLLRGQTA